MINKKILVIAPYPIVRPYHGGQKRAKAIFEFYKHSFQEAKFTAVFHRGQYPDWDKDDLPLGQADLIQKVDEMPYASELICGEAIDKDIHVRSYMAKLLLEYKPDIIHLEQPFAYLGLEPLLKELQLTPKLIFGSQNIEYPLKERIFKEVKAPVRQRKFFVEQTKKLEYKLSKRADLLIAVNAEDAASHKQMGAKKIVIVPNGIDRSVATKEELDYWHTYKKEKNIKNIVLFVGSGHPPNWEGFLKLVGSDTSFMPKESKIFIVGGVAGYFERAFKDRRINKRFWSGVESIGVLEEERLAALLEMSDLVILPITTKRGSNLKTAEAILSAKKIVATEYAFHGFEEYRRLPNIYVATKQVDFSRAIVKALQSAYVVPTQKEKELAEQVQWQYRLLPLESRTVVRVFTKKSFGDIVVRLKKAVRAFSHKFLHHSR